MDNLGFQKILKEHKEQINALDRKSYKKFNKLTEGKFATPGFKRFFMVKLKKTGYYDDKTELKNEAKHAIENMKYDMKNGDSLFTAFEKACRDLHIESDGIESYV